MLVGTYVIDQPSSTEAFSLQAFQGFVIPGAITVVDLPQAPGLSDLSCQVTAATKTDVSTAEWTIESDPSGAQSLTRKSQRGPVAIDASSAGNKILIKGS